MTLDREGGEGEISAFKNASPYLVILSIIGALFLLFSLLTNERSSTEARCEVRYVVHPEWYENKEPVAVVTSCGILNTGDEDLADSLIIGGLYSFELRDVTVGQNARRHIVKATLE